MMIVSGSPLPAHGYSKAHRPDLKQVMLSLTQGGAANIPLWMESLDGNTSDTTSFHKTVRRVEEFMSNRNYSPCSKERPYLAKIGIKYFKKMLKY